MTHAPALPQKREVYIAMVFIGALLALILGALAYMARLILVAEARNRHNSDRLPDSATSGKGRSGAKESTVAQQAIHGKSRL